MRWDRRPRRALERVLELLAAEPASVSSVTDPARAWDVHVADSLCGLEVEQLAKAERIADIGSGAGFPGIVLWPWRCASARVDLIESVERKCRFMRRAVEQGRDRQRRRCAAAAPRSWRRARGARPTRP